MPETISIAPEAPQHDDDIESIHAEAFGPGRYARAAFRVREGGPHDRDLSFVALKDGNAIASVRLTPILVGNSPGLLLGPLAVRPAFKNLGWGRKLMVRALEAAHAHGHGLVILVGDRPYYEPFGFRVVPAGRIAMPGPVDPNRLLALELQPGSFENVQGTVRWGRQAA